jgi:hypothetical protein
MPEHTMFLPITKVDEDKHEIWGWGAIEQPDAVDEIMDYQSSKPLFMDWSSAAQRRSGGRSMGNLRSMHQTKVAGKLIDFRPDDTTRGFFVGAKIVDDGEWQKVKEGVYTGFSIGGSYVKRWPDGSRPGLVRYTAKPTELSIVDAPCIPGATFSLVKSDSSKVVPFKPGDGTLALQWEPEDDLDKAIPTPPTPAPASEMALTGATGLTISISQMPPPSNTVTLTGNTDIPSTETLTQALVRTREMTDSANSLIKVMTELKNALPGLIAQAVREELGKLLSEDVDGGDPAAGDPHMIKVVRE